MKKLFTIEEHVGFYSLHEGCKRIAVISDCEDGVAERIAGAMNKGIPETPAPPEGWKLSVCGGFFLRTGNDQWIVPEGAQVFGHKGWEVSYLVGGVSMTELSYRVPVSRMREGGAV